MRFRQPVLRCTNRVIGATLFVAIRQTPRKSMSWVTRRLLCLMAKALVFELRRCSIRGPHGLPILPLPKEKGIHFALGFGVSKRKCWGNLWAEKHSVCFHLISYWITSNAA